MYDMSVFNKLKIVVLIVDKLLECKRNKTLHFVLFMKNNHLVVMLASNPIDDYIPIKASCHVLFLTHYQKIK